MRRLQKTEQADRQGMNSLEDKEYLGAHRTTNGESTAQDGIQFVDRRVANGDQHLEVTILGVTLLTIHFTGRVRGKLVV
ncbi:hypothetical protein [Lactiplantibacillus plantarum]|uniref:hypothetical protein n=1 Tax=Lactiplantibacillus plantarum TaxID=1590 RepID=UPI00404580DD